MIKLPTGVYWVILGILLLVTIAFAFAAVYLAVQGRAIPTEISGPMITALTGAGAFVFSKHDDADEGENK
jgi:hypothetical protein